MPQANKSEKSKQWNRSPLFTAVVDAELLTAFRETTASLGVSQSRIVRDAMIKFLRENNVDVVDAIGDRPSSGSRLRSRKTGDAMAA